MSLNRFMHPRNIYRVKKNFTLLADEFPDFAQHVKYFENGNATIDFKDPQSLRSLTITLLKKDFDLDVDLPADRLIPAVPQRLNYVLWIEDLVSSLDLPVNSPVRGIDVGTGASCIFPLLMCRNNKDWIMTAFDVDTEALFIAEQNVSRNNLSHRIKLSKVNDGSSWSQQVLHSSDVYHFLVCNPPFFNCDASHEENEFEDNNNGIDDDSHQETSDREKRGKSSSNTSCVTEAIVAGGEVAFVKAMIHESFTLKNKIRIFSVMLGKKSSLISLKKELKNFQSENSDLSFTCTEFCQGKTMRWGIAWSFTVKLESAHVQKIKKPSKPLILAPIPYKKGMYYSIDGFTDRILDLIIQDLNIKTFKLTRMSQVSSEIILKSLSNTWSNQRRKRREQKQRLMATTESHESGMGTSPSLESSTETSPVQSHKRKRGNDDDGDFCDSPASSSSFTHNTKLPGSEFCKRPKEHVVTVEAADNDINYLLNCSISLRKEGKGITLKVEPREPCQTSESAHQIFQYFKNKLSEVNRERLNEDSCD